MLVAYNTRWLTHITVLYLAFWERKNALLMRTGKISYENHETGTWLLLAQTIFLFIMFNHVPRLEFLSYYTRMRRLYKNIQLSCMKIQLCLELCWCLSEFILKIPLAHHIRIGLLSLSSCFWPCYLFFRIVNDYFIPTSSTKAIFFFWRKYFSLSVFFKPMHCFQRLWIAHHITNPAHYYALSTAACCNAIFTLWH